METKHTPTPYTLLGGTRIWLTGADERSVGSIHRPEDAAFIVKACNSHAALLEALELAHTAMSSVPTLENDDELNNLLNDADNKAVAAIAKAKAEQS